MRNLNLIAAVGENLELGYENDLIWRIREDLQFFKEKTMGSYIIMGRKTYDSMPKNLKGRKYIVLSRDKTINSNDKLKVFRSIEDTLGFVKEEQDSKFYVVGGGQIYTSFLNYVQSMDLTEIKESFKLADTYFPKFNKEEWIKEEGPLLEDKNTKYKHVLYLRKEYKRK